MEEKNVSEPDALALLLLGYSPLRLLPEWHRLPASRRVAEQNLSSNLLKMRERHASQLAKISRCKQLLSLRGKEGSVRGANKSVKGCTGKILGVMTAAWAGEVRVGAC